MNIQQYKKNRWEAEKRELERYRVVCSNCFQPLVGCYCSVLRPFDPQIEFVILIHPIEARKRIATGRLSHLILKNSHFFRGQNFAN
ncbi:MAG: DTW domain-containing protein, partial [Bdellovibrionales bacterium]|nr:DTW domain-containing protein [Bdellovibrionales bacterium]